MLAGFAAAALIPEPWTAMLIGRAAPAHHRALEHRRGTARRRHRGRRVRLRDRAGTGTGEAPTRTAGAERECEGRVDPRARREFRPVAGVDGDRHVLAHGRVDRHRAEVDARRIRRGRADPGSLDAMLIGRQLPPPTGHSNTVAVPLDGRHRGRRVRLRDRAGARAGEATTGSAGAERECEGRVDPRARRELCAGTGVDGDRHVLAHGRVDRHRAEIDARRIRSRGADPGALDGYVDRQAAPTHHRALEHRRRATRRGHRSRRIGLRHRARPRPGEATARAAGAEREAERRIDPRARRELCAVAVIDRDRHVTAHGRVDRHRTEIDARRACTARTSASCRRQECQDPSQQNNTDARAHHFYSPLAG